MKTYVSISMAILVASLLVPEVFGQHAEADLDRLPIFGMPDRKAPIPAPIWGLRYGASQPIAPES
jgi:hypothetical protein